MEIVPAILEHEWNAIDAKLRRLRGVTRWVQIDVADGEFAGPATWRKPDDLWALEHDFFIELHLMIARPWEQMSVWLRSGANRLVVHAEPFIAEAEYLERLDHVINKAKETDREIGIALNPETPWGKVERYIDAAEHILFLGVTPGESGQAFREEVLGKIHTLREAHPDVIIAVDGGVNAKTAGRLAKAGANRLISSSFIFSFENPQEGIDALTEAAQEGYAHS